MRTASGSRTTVSRALRSGNRLMARVGGLTEHHALEHPQHVRRGQDDAAHGQQHLREASWAEAPTSTRNSPMKLEVPGRPNEATADRRRDTASHGIGPSIPP